MTAEREGHADGLPVAEQWYDSRVVGEGLTVIWEPHVLPLLRANIWHLHTPGFNLVIDSGLGVASLRGCLPHLFEGDCAVVVTHAHLDHMGSAHEFEQCWAHSAEPLGAPHLGALRRGPLSEALGLELDGSPDELLIDARPHAEYDPSAYKLSPARVTRQLHDGDLIELPGRTLTVLHLPGHTAGSIALYEQEARSLFSGDVVYDLEPGEQLLDEMHGSEVDSYIASMQRLATLPVDMVYPGHGHSFDGTRLRELARDYVTSRTGGKI
ncbi:MBL fold metallo-hydrolase [Leekyejoonella antrihumi]|nr:MBL fold metallo-hydrolase [Leekyejoonella antrihumi]